MKRMITVWLLAGMLGGCAAGTDFTWENARKIRPGMTAEEVHSLMGRPYMVRTVGDRTIWTWSHATSFGGAKALAVSFDKDGKIIEAPRIPDGYHD